MFKRYRDIMERRQSRESSESGFTLIELLIVIVVLGILAAIVVFSLTGVTGQSKSAACTTDAKSVQVAADAYQAKTGNWPTTVGVSGLVPDYLHSQPVSTNDYTISIGATNVLVAPNGSATAVPFDGAGGCSVVK